MRVNIVYNTCMVKHTSRHPQITVYLPQHLIDALKREAKHQGRSMNNQVVWYIADGLGVAIDESDTRVQDRTRPNE